MANVLLHIGYPKAGSRYLKEWFSANPNFLYQPNSILGFNNVGDLSVHAQHSPNSPRYFVLSSEELIVWKGDIDVVGLKYVPYDIIAYQNRACQTLSRLFPNAKVLIVTRGFASTCVSIYSEAILAGYFESFERYQDLNREILPIFYDYNFIIGLYRDAFGPQNTIVLPYELLKEDPSAFLSIIEGELELEPGFQFPKDRINPSLEVDRLVAYRKISKMLFESIKFLPYSAQKSIYSLYVRRLYHARLTPLSLRLSKIIGEPEVWKVRTDILELFRGKAEIFREHKLFARYHSEYLL